MKSVSPATAGCAGRWRARPCGRGSASSRSLNNIYVQVIDDTTGHTLVAASSRDPEVAKQQTGASKTQVARLVGLVAAKRAIQAGVTLAVFDRGGYRFHGRVKSLAEGMREGGLKV